MFSEQNNILLPMPPSNNEASASGSAMAQLEMAAVLSIMAEEQGWTPDMLRDSLVHVFDYVGEDLDLN